MNDRPGGAAPRADVVDSTTDGVRCMLMRGGTSKGAYFLASDLPADRASIDDLVLRVMGSPDERQVDGLGGAHPLTSKVAIVSPSAEIDADVDYLFLQVSVDEPLVSDAQTCGNLLAGVGPFAVERGLVAPGDGETSVRIRLVNTGDTATATFPTRGAGAERPGPDGAAVSGDRAAGGHVVYDGDQAIDGVPGTAAPVTIEMGAVEPRPILPTGNVVDEIADGEGGSCRATLVNAGMPVVLLDAADFGVEGDEDPENLEANAELRRRVEAIRLAAGPLMGLGDVSDQTVPKVFLLSPPRGHGTLSTRAFIPHRVHTSIGVLMAASVAAGVRIPGAVGHDLARVDDDTRLEIEHPSGAFAALLRVEERPGTGWVASYSANLRTARKIFDGRVFPRPRL